MGLFAASVLTGDETNITKFVILGIVSVVLVIGVTVLGVTSSKKDEHVQEDDDALESETEEK